MSTTPSGFVVLVPVKAPALAKSRLVGLPGYRRAVLARSFALDTLTAALAASPVVAVYAVTADADFARSAMALGARQAPDGRDLNDALSSAARLVRAEWPQAMPVALCADLPALRPDDLSAALAMVHRDRGGLVADAERVGSTMYAAPYDAFTPRFGSDSRRAHLAGGVEEITADLATLRRDVDDLDDLDAARVLGLGQHSRDALASLRSA